MPRQFLACILRGDELDLVMQINLTLLLLLLPLATAVLVLVLRELSDGESTATDLQPQRNTLQRDTALLRPVFSSRPSRSLPHLATRPRI